MIKQGLDFELKRFKVPSDIMDEDPEINAMFYGENK